MPRPISERRLAAMVKDANQRLRWDDCCYVAPSTLKALIAEVRAARAKNVTPEAP